jgi:hypothetical protein
MFVLRIQRTIQRQVKFAFQSGVGGISVGIFAVGGMLYLAAAHGEAFHHRRQLIAQGGGIALLALLRHLVCL